MNNISLTMALTTYGLVCAYAAAPMERHRYGMSGDIIHRHTPTAAVQAARLAESWVANQLTFLPEWRESL